MCGFAGYAGNFGSEDLGRAIGSLAHRGPDGQGIWTNTEARVGLAHRRLSIIDLSPAAHQPMLAPNGVAVIAYNGEIYNFKELRKELESSGYNFVSQSDTEVLLALYLREGESMLNR